MTRTLRMAARTLLLVAAAGFAAQTLADAHAKPVLNVTGSFWPPYLDTSLNEGGLAADLVRTALTRAGYDVQGDTESWPRAFTGTSIGIYDAVAAIWETHEREASLAFSRPYLFNEIVLVSRANAGIRFDDLESLVGYRIGVVKGYAYNPEFDQHPALRRVPENHLHQNLRKLLEGRIDLVVGDRYAVEFQIARSFGQDAEQFHILTPHLTRRGLRLGVALANPDHQEILSRFETAIDGMREDGTFQEIVASHTENP